LSTVETLDILLWLLFYHYSITRRRPSNNTSLWRQNSRNLFIEPNEQRLQPQNIYGHNKNYGLWLL